MELGGCVGDGDERYHDEIGIDFGLTLMHDAGMPLLDCTADIIFKNKQPEKENACAVEQGCQTSLNEYRHA